MKPRFLTLWAINAALDQGRLRRQLEQFCEAGFDGVVWHPRFYPNDPPYLSRGYLDELSEVILHAKSLGLAFWIYDEDGWPSGTVGGQLLEKYPADAQRWAELVTEKPAHCLAEFEIHDSKRGNQRWFLAERIGAGVDYLNPELARHFLELTHERYRTGLAPEAWQHVEAFFCDEPEFGLGHAYDSLSPYGAIPWTPQLPQLFRQRHGGELLPLIPRIFFPGEDAAEIRVKFWELLTDVFNESFTVPLNDWCRRHGKLFTAHLKGEEHPLFQVPTSGSCHQFFRHLSLPAIDALERYPSGHFFPRQVSSAARQFGDGRCMVEAFGGAGWGATPEDLERYLLWLGRHGLTDFVMHLSQYRLDSAAIRDWPPSQPLHLTWRDAYPEILRRVRRELESHPRAAADTLVITPARGIMANYQPQEFLETNIHNAATYPDSDAGKMNRRFLACVEGLHRAGVNHDFADERTVEQFAKLAGKSLALGNCRYQRVIVCEGAEINEATRALIAPFVIDAPASVPAGIAIESKRAGADAGAPIAVHWSLEKHPLNLLPLECTCEAGGWFQAMFESSTALPDASLEFVFADDIAEAELNGQKLKCAGNEDGSVMALEAPLVEGTNMLRFRPVKSSVERPFVWLRGLFRVISAKPFVAGPGHTLKTDGLFTLHPADDTVTEDLLASGFPFLRGPLVLVGELTLPHAISMLRMDGLEADAVRLAAGDRDSGWTWRTNGEVGLCLPLPAGTHRLRLELVPSAFNPYGPHHHYCGDRHVVSPDQFKGVRNFADPADAPKDTCVAEWHLSSFRLPHGISVIL